MPMRYVVIPSVGRVVEEMPRSALMGSKVAVYDVLYTTTTSVLNEIAKTTRPLYHVGQLRGS